MFILEMHARCFLQVAELRKTTPNNNFKMCALGFPECEERGFFFPISMASKSLALRGHLKQQ